VNAADEEENHKLKTKSFGILATLVGRYKYLLSIDRHTPETQ
jgi:hypothetical protein